MEQLAAYFDTPDARLTRSGASLRYRSDDGWTVKLPAPSEGSNLVRIERNFAGNDGTPPAGALDLLRAWLRSESIDQVAEVRTYRHRVVLNDATGSKLAEIDDDRVTTSSRHGLRTEFRELEVELSDQAPARLDRKLARRLKSGGVTRRSSLPKIARALGMSESRPDVGPIVRSVDLGADATMFDLTRGIISPSVARLLANDPLIRMGDDPEAVHQARVATRRLRSDLRTFGPAMDEQWSEALRAELRWLGVVLGKVRDIDVLTELLRSTLTRIPEDHDAEPLFDRLAEQRDRERDALLVVLKSLRYVTLLDRLVDVARDPNTTHDIGPRRAHDVALRLGRRPWRRLRKSIRELDREPNDADLHRVRRRAKQARYALEAVSDIAGKREAERAERAARVQETLGEHQDRVVAQRWLLDSADALHQTRAAFTAGQLSGLLASDQRTLRELARKELRDTGRH